jgi:hypothetical protein
MTCARGTAPHSSRTSTRPSNNPRSTKRYYSFDWGDAHFVALNSEPYYDDKGYSPEEQKVFFQEDLAATRKRSSNRGYDLQGDAGANASWSRIYEYDC